MSSPATASAAFFISGINHCELQAGQQLTLDHLRSLQQQLAEQAGRARAIQQQLQQQAVQQGLRPAAVVVKAEPGAAAAVKKEEDTGPTPTPTPPAAQQTQQQLQYAALLALQLQQQQQQQQQQARAAAAAAQAQQQQQVQGTHQQQQQQQQQARPAGAPATAFPGAPAALAQNVFPQQGAGGRQGVMAGGPGGLPQHSAVTAAAAGRAGSGGAQATGRRQAAAAAKQAKEGYEEGDEAATDQWVQCSKCQTWRQVPDEFWPDIANADEDEDWMCKDALWDVEDYEPNTPACC